MIVNSKSLEYTFLSNEDRAPLKRGSSDSAGVDLSSAEDVIIGPGESCGVSTKIAFNIPQGYFGLVRARSGLSFKGSIEVGAGVVDSDFKGEVKVKLYNLGKEHFHVTKDMRIAQIIIIPYAELPLKKVEDVYNDTERGTNGFGSSGL